MQNELYSGKELACLLKRERKYISEMKRKGFVMVSNRATLESALEWLTKNPNPRARHSAPHRATSK